MSGICGAWSFIAGGLDLTPILALLERRGPDGAHHWHDGPVALGHTLLATTPEALVEVLPLTEPESGCTITADARLDNRQELIAALDPHGGTRTIGDGELILRAYLKWGEQCPKHLLGDFAFAIWDPRAKRLFCARDHMGMRQLIYHHAPNRLFAFATEADALVAHPAVPKRINVGRIADFLDGLEGLDFTSTFFDDVVRLPPAHTLIVTSSGLALRRYWKLQPGPELKLDTDQDYARAFLEVFTQAVRCRLRSAGPVGSMLSGGLDSNSIAAIAARQLAEADRGPLRTFSVIGPDHDECAESSAIQVAIRSPLFSPTLIRYSDLPPGEALRMTQQCAEPFDAYSSINMAVYAAARRAGINVMFDGAGADVTLTAGNRVADLLSQAKIRKAVREARLEARFWGPIWPARKILMRSCWAAFAPDLLRRLRWRLAWWVQDFAMEGGHSGVSREFAQTAKLGRRRKRFRRHWWRGRPTDAAYRAHSVRHPHLVVARERYDRVAAAFGIEPRDPFMDLRLIQFALSLPPAQLQADGWPKVILRRAMADKMPGEIAWRHGKPHVGWAFKEQLIAEWMALSAEETSIPWANEIFGRARKSNITSGMDKANWLKLMILKSWIARNCDAPGEFNGGGDNDDDEE